MERVCQADLKELSSLARSCRSSGGAMISVELSMSEQNLSRSMEQTLRNDLVIG